MQVFINNKTRFCYQSKENFFTSNTLGRMQIYEQEKIKIENLIDDDLEKSSPDECHSESDKDNDECNE